mmetsp:Transcript_43703/g.77039  ORF Transcript_43703/g.77039 Transcript_43703/m.77039 type:complete len:444 (+) Transcript_43703:726-2057(+)
MAVRLHVQHLALAQAQGLHHAALVDFLDVGGHQLHRLALDAVDVLEHYARLGHGEFVALAAHVLQQDGQVQFAATADLEDAVLVGLGDAQRHVVLQLLLQAVPDLAAGDVLAFTAGQRAGVDAEVHRQRRLVDLEHRQRLRVGRVGHRHADADLLDAVDQHDIARAGFGDLHAVQAVEGQHLVDAAVDALAAGAFHHRDLHAGLDGALADAADADAADEGGEVQRRDLQLQRRGRVALLRRHMLQDGLEQGRHVGPPLLAGRAFGQRGPAVDTGRIDHREVQLLIVGAELVEQVEGRVDDGIGLGARLVDLVDDDDRLQAQGQRLLGDEAGLRHRAFLGVDQQHHAVHHGQRALHLAAEVRVPRGVDDVDVGAAPADRAVLGQDGDAALAFDGVAVHHGVDDLFMVGEGTALAQQLVHHGGLAVVDVGDDGDVADRGGHGTSR